MDGMEEMLVERAYLRNLRSTDPKGAVERLAGDQALR